MDDIHVWTMDACTEEMVMTEGEFEGFKMARWEIGTSIRKTPTLTAVQAIALLDDRIMEHLRQRDKQ